MSFNVRLFTIALATRTKDEVEATVVQAALGNKVSGDEMFLVRDNGGTIANQNPAVQAVLVRMNGVRVEPVHRLTCKVTGHSDHCEYLHSGRSMPQLGIIKLVLR